MDVVGRLDVDAAAIRAAGGYALVTDDAVIVAAEVQDEAEGSWDGWTVMGLTAE